VFLSSFFSHPAKVCSISLAVAAVFFFFFSFLSFSFPPFPPRLHQTRNTFMRALPSFLSPGSPPLSQAFWSAVFTVDSFFFFFSFVFPLPTGARTEVDTIFPPFLVDFFFFPPSSHPLVAGMRAQYVFLSRFPFFLLFMVSEVPGHHSKPGPPFPPLPPSSAISMELSPALGCSRTNNVSTPPLSQPPS